MNDDIPAHIECIRELEINSNIGSVANVISEMLSVMDELNQKIPEKTDE